MVRLDCQAWRCTVRESSGSTRSRHASTIGTTPCVEREITFSPTKSGNLAMVLIASSSNTPLTFEVSAKTGTVLHENTGWRMRSASPPQTQAASSNAAAVGLVEGKTANVDMLHAPQSANLHVPGCETALCRLHAR